MNVSLLVLSLLAGSDQPQGQANPMGDLLPNPVVFRMYGQPADNPDAGVYNQAGSFGEAVTCTRASVATDVIGGVFYQWPANTLRTDGNGILTEAAATNLYLNSLAPALQTITVSSSTAYVISVIGTGSSVVASGACTGTVTPGSPLACTTSTTSLVVTNGATVPTCVQVETGSVPTSCIPTTGSTATRAADVVKQSTVFTPEIARRGSISFDIVSFQTYLNNTGLLAAFSSGSAYITIQAQNSTTNKFSIEYYNGTQDYLAQTASLADTHLAASWDVDLGIVCIAGNVNGKTCSTHPAFAPVSTSTIPVTIGNDTAVDSALGSVLRNICVGRTTSACQ